MVSTYSSRTSLAMWRSLVIRNSLKILHTHHTDVITMVMSILSALGYMALIGHELLIDSAHTSYWCHHNGDEHSECTWLRCAHWSSETCLKILHTHHTDAITMVMSILSASHWTFTMVTDSGQCSIFTFLCSITVYKTM